MYANVVRKDLQKKETLKSIIDTDLKDFKADSPNVKMADAGTLPTRRDKHEATVKYFSGSKDDRHEAVAYIDEAKFVVMLVMTCTTEKGFKASLPAFKELVASYFLVSDNVTTQLTK